MASEKEGRGDEATSRYRVEALTKGLKILALFSKERSVLKLKEIVDLTGIPMPTAYRLVATLEGEGYVERSPDGAIRPGLAVLALGFGAIHGLDLVQTASNALQELHRRTGETVNLGVLVGDQMLFVARDQRPFSLVAADIRVGSTVPAVFSSIGKVLLAALPEDELKRRITDESFATRWGPRAVRSLNELKVQLEEIRTTGHFVQREEAVVGLTSVAAPIRQAGNEVVAGMNIAIATSEYDDARVESELTPALLAACAEVSMRLGATVSETIPFTTP